MGSVRVGLVSRFNAAGLRVRAVETHNSQGTLDLEENQTQITHSRCWKVRLGLKALLRWKSCTDICLEVIIGHCTFLALVQRAALATFHDAFHPKESSHSRKDVALGAPELDIFCGLLSFPHSDWRAPFSCAVRASGASEEAWGFATSQRGSTNVLRAGETFSSCQRNTSSLTRVGSRSKCWDSSGQ